MYHREKRSLDTNGNDDGDRKRPALSSVIFEALKMDALQKLCSELEPNLRRIVSEEVDRALTKVEPLRTCLRSPPMLEEESDGRILQLHFRSKLSLNLFTGGKVEGEQGRKIYVELVDARTGEVVINGAESTLKLEVVVLEGDFNNEDQESWTEEEFSYNIVKEREGKRPLLIGDLQVTLREGVGTLGELMFTDNSSWTKSRKFRLGLRVASDHSVDVRIRGAKSEAFAVKDQRGELYKKHYPPAPSDEVWRLEKIGKDGSFHKRLSEAGIHTVEAFLQLVIRDPQKMRNILGSGMSNKMWEVLIEHAKTCSLSEKHYSYSPENMKDLSVIFNNVSGIRGVISCGHYLPVESLAEDNKLKVIELTKKAYENWKSVVEFDSRSLRQNQSLNDSGNQYLTAQQQFPNFYREQIALPDYPYPSKEQDTFDKNEVFLDLHYQHRNHPTPMQNVEDMQQFLSQRQDDFTSQHPCNQSMSDYHYGGMPPHDICVGNEELLQNEEMQHLLDMVESGLPYYRSDHEVCHYPAASDHPNLNGCRSDGVENSTGTALMGWLKLKSALRWGFFVRRQAALRGARLIELD